MKIIFKIAEIGEKGSLKFHIEDFESYGDAVKALENLPDIGYFQIQKLFKK